MKAILVPVREADLWQFPLDTSNLLWQTPPLLFINLVYSRNGVTQDFTTEVFYFWCVPQTRPVTNLVFGTEASSTATNCFTPSLFVLTDAGAEWQDAALARFDQAVQCRLWKPIHRYIKIKYKIKSFYQKQNRIRASQFICQVQGTKSVTHTITIWYSNNIVLY